MFKNIKATIKELAYAAVHIAEQSLNTKDGQGKKQMAIEYVVSMLPIFQPLKSIIALVLSKFIDDAIEQAVIYMKEIKNLEA